MKNAFKRQSGRFKKLFHHHFRSLFSVAIFIQLKTADVYLDDYLSGRLFEKIIYLEDILRSWVIETKPDNK